MAGYTVTHMHTHKHLHGVGSKKKMCLGYFISVECIRNSQVGFFFKKICMYYWFASRSVFVCVLLYGVRVLLCMVYVCVCMVCVCLCVYGCMVCMFAVCVCFFLQKKLSIPFIIQVDK